MNQSLPDIKLSKSKLHNYHLGTLPNNTEITTNNSSSKPEPGVYAYITNGEYKGQPINGRYRVFVGTHKPRVKYSKRYNKYYISVADTDTDEFGKGNYHSVYVPNMDDIKLEEIVSETTPMSVEQARASELTQYVPLEPCKYGHFKRYVKTNRCVECMGRLNRARYQSVKNPTSIAHDIVDVDNHSVMKLEYIKHLKATKKAWAEVKEEALNAATNAEEEAAKCNAELEKILGVNHNNTTH